jgi:uncharacterized protein (DUF58 family)
VRALIATLRKALGERLAAWARRRQGADLVPLTLHARRIYILPTRAGIGFAALLLMMLIAALNYTNSMAMLLTFMLAGFAMVGIHECHRNLKGLRVVLAEAADSFAGKPGHIELRFENTLAVPRLGLTIRCESSAWSHFELPPRSVCLHHIEYLRTQRGRQRLGRIELATTAPLGLFRAWCWLHLPIDALVYPMAAGKRPLPAQAAQRQSLQQRAQAAGAEEWAALRPFTPGDSPRGVAWKLYARGAPLLVAQYEGTASQHHALDYQILTGLDVEARLSQLCAWILRCEQLREPWSLRLPGELIVSGTGTAHQRAALRALALHGSASG